MNLPKVLKLERIQKDTKKFYQKSKVYVVSLIFSVVSKTGFGILLADQVCLKSENKKFLETSKCMSQG
jgi:hypothetical protein